MLYEVITSHRSVIGRRKKLESPMHMKIRRGEQRFSYVSDDQGCFVELAIEVAKESVQGYAVVGPLRRRFNGKRGRERPRRLRGEPVGSQCLDKVLKSDRVIAMSYNFV